MTESNGRGRRRSWATELELGTLAGRIFGSAGRAVSG